MATPTRQQARRAYDLQQAVADQAADELKAQILSGAGVRDLLGALAVYQLASATSASESVAGYTGSTGAVTQAAVLSGVSSAGFPVSEPLVALIDSIVAAPVEAVPDMWWTPAEVARFIEPATQLLRSEVLDAGRTASQVEFVARPEWQNYVRMLVGTSCDRCTVLAGRVYRDLKAFARHPGCDCIMVPVQSWEDAHDEGYVASAAEAFDAGRVTGLSGADVQAIEDGADIAKVVNAKRGMTTADIFGKKRVKATTAGTTKRAQWRKDNPTRLVRLRPEAIYRFAKDRDDAIRLLRLYGYL